LTEGYQEAAEHFQMEANVEPAEDTSTLEERMKVREAIESGHIERAVELIDSHFPGLLLSNNELRFQLQVNIGQHSFFVGIKCSIYSYMLLFIIVVKAKIEDA